MLSEAVDMGSFALNEESANAREELIHSLAKLGYVDRTAVAESSP